ncbi:phytanoyl-CoA dioxygenase family protein, partial [Planktomarina temperata]|nr:phytanoyl-CoA dioxygenase family protein [Planktomarina temperata]
MNHHYLITSFFESGANDDIRQIALDMRENGFAVVRGLIPDIEEYCDKIVADVSNEFHFETIENDNNEHLKKVEPRRIINAAKKYESVSSVASHEKVLDLLTRLYGRQAYPFQTLNFPMGTEQHFHTDSIHFSSYPEKFMAGVWVALEDISMDQGPLVYYPGTHKWPVFENVHYGIDIRKREGKFHQSAYEEAWRAMIEAEGIEPQ